jgi:hypothetical protein
MSQTMSDSSNRDREDASLSKKLDELYELIEGIEIAMFTTRRSHPGMGLGERCRQHLAGPPHH